MGDETARRKCRSHDQRAQATDPCHARYLAPVARSTPSADAVLPPPWPAATSGPSTSHDETVDLVVVGAGITGAGLARDAAARGLSVQVFEARDVAAGTSSRSSRLIHGGVRYLEHGELHLVHEALRERATLLRTAPHLVRPARFLFPAYRGDRLPPWKLRLGLALYDLLAGPGARPHEALPPATAAAAEPLLRREGLRGAVRYDDAITDDARLTLSVLQDARRLGAHVHSYRPVRTIERDGAGARIHLEDGAIVRTRACVVAAGPWTGPRLLGTPARDLLTLSKGVHLVLRAADVPVRAPVVIQVPGQRRILFAVPWGTRTYLGTTDTHYDGDPADCSVRATDEAEVLGIVGRVLSGARLEPERVMSAWAGVRPLVRPAGRATSTADVSRSHRTLRPAPGLWALVGGKLTTYRAMAEEVIDQVCAHLGGGFAPCVTASRPLVPGAPLGRAELADPLLADLAPRHGPVARVLASQARAAPALAARMAPDLPYRWIEVHHALAFEGVRHLDDLLRRRLPLALTTPDQGASVARQAAELLRRARGEPAAAGAAELERYVQVIARETRRRPQP